MVIASTCFLLKELSVPSKPYSTQNYASLRRFRSLRYLHLRKEVIQPHLPIRLPCYDFTPVIDLTLDNVLLAVRLLASGALNSHGVTGGVYKARERIHRGMLIRDYEQLRLHVGGLQPTIRTGTAFMRSASSYDVASLCYSHCSTCVAQDIRGMMI